MSISRVNKPCTPPPPPAKPFPKIMSAKNSGNIVLFSSYNSGFYLEVLWGGQKPGDEFPGNADNCVDYNEVVCLKNN